MSCFAPDAPQQHVIDHIKGAPVVGETRNSMIEAARITRGDIKPLSTLSPSHFDALLLPGGFGAAKNLSSFAAQGANMTVNPDVCSDT